MAIRSTSKVLSPREKLLALAAIDLLSRGYSRKQTVAALRSSGFGVDEPKLTELLKAAKERNWIWQDSIFNLDPQDLPSDIDPELLEKARATAPDRSRLKDLLGNLSAKTLRNVDVCHSGHEGTSKEQWAERLKDFSRFASKRVLTLLKPSVTVGVGWGHTVAALVHALNTPVARRLRKRDIQFVPTCGEPLKPSGPDNHADRACTYLAALLADLFDQKNRHFSLAGVIAVVPEKFRTPEGMQFLLDYFAVISDHRAILGPTADGSNPLVDQMDTIITSVGSFSQDWKLYTSQLHRARGITREELAENFLGDIGGAIIPPSRLSRTQKEEYEKIKQSWTGIKREHYREIARKATELGRPGVIVVAIGANKAAIVLEVVKLRLVNELIVDHDLAAAIHRQLKSAAGARQDHEA